MAEMVTVRIAVALDNEGHYEVAGGDGQSDDERRGYATMWMEERDHPAWACAREADGYLSLGWIDPKQGKVVGERRLPEIGFRDDPPWPLPNVWLGVSVEDQATAGQRIPLLLQCPAAVRFVSYEPALGPVNFKSFMPRALFHCAECGQEKLRSECQKCGTFDNPVSNEIRGLDWIIVGGESGPKARPFNVGWAESAAEQCAAANVPVFVKQFGGRPYVVYGSPGDYAWLRDADTAALVGFPVVTDPKGGDPAEWPEHLRVRQFPAATGRTA